MIICGKSLGFVSPNSCRSCHPPIVLSVVLPKFEESQYTFNLCEFVHQEILSVQLGQKGISNNT
jgi:hypothetical protein